MNEDFKDMTREQLMVDFKTVVADAEALLKATADQGGEELTAARVRAEASLRTVKDRLAAEQVAMIARSREMAGAADAYVHENPWAAIGIASAVGLVLGLLSARH